MVTGDKKLKNYPSLKKTKRNETKQTKQNLCYRRDISTSWIASVCTTIGSSAAAEAGNGSGGGTH